MGVRGCPPESKKGCVRKKLKIKKERKKRIQSKEETKWRTQRNK